VLAEDGLLNTEQFLQFAVALPPIDADRVQDGEPLRMGGRLSQAMPAA